MDAVFPEFILAVCYKCTEDAIGCCGLLVTSRAFQRSRGLGTDSTRRRLETVAKPHTSMQKR